MKVLIYGDSNTWGDNFYTNKRIEDDKQWPNLLQKRLSDFKILQEGLPGRIAGDYEEKKFKNGKDTFISTFKTKAPVDIIIISLGTNDLQLKYNRTLDDIYKDLMWYKNTLIKLYQDEGDKEKYFNNQLPKIYYISPINFDYLNEAKFIFNESKEKIRKELELKLNDENNILLENADLFEDGVHLSYVGHKQMCDAVYEALKND